VDNGLSAEQERILEGLGAVPSDLTRLVERYAGRTRLSPSDADSLLATLAQPSAALGLVQPQLLQVQLDQVARTPGERFRNEAEDLGSSHLESNLVTVGLKADAVGLKVEVGLKADVGRDMDRTSESGINSDLVAQPTAEQPRSGALIEASADTSEPKDGPLTRRMDARDVRVFPVARKAAFSAGILGADDLPEFPVIRSPSVVKEVEEAKSVVAMPTDSAASEQTDSFEILVDEEILEIEPDDPVFDESDED
jgi:hypothetical protein